MQQAEKWWLRLKPYRFNSFFFLPFCGNLSCSYKDLFSPFALWVAVVCWRPFCSCLLCWNMNVENAFFLVWTLNSSFVWQLSGSSTRAHCTAIAQQLCHLLSKMKKEKVNGFFLLSWDYFLFCSVHQCLMLFVSTCLVSCLYRYLSVFPLALHLFCCMVRWRVFLLCHWFPGSKDPHSGRLNWSCSALSSRRNLEVSNFLSVYG